MTVTTSLAPGREVAGELRPRFRGVLHLVTAVFAPAGLVALILLADSPRQYVGGAIFATTLILLYTSSAQYHLAPWARRWDGIAKRIDHSMIFVLIAGSYTPFCLVVLSNAWGIPMLSVVWTLAAAGVLMKIRYPHAPRWISTGFYVALGWVGVIAVVPVVRALDPAPLAMLAAGGLMYTLGALVYATRRPDPLPRVFGFHEVFHTFVIAGSVIHFVLIAAYVM